MKDLEFSLREKLKDVSCLAVLGVGSELRADDAIGMMIAQALSKVKKSKINFCSFQGSTAPENFTGEIKKLKPSHLLIIDAFEMGKEAGCAMVFEPEDAKSAVSFSTHRMPLEILINYLCKYFSCCVIILGIQPESLEFMGPVSGKVKAAAGKIEKIIKKIIQ